MSPYKFKVLYVVCALNPYSLTPTSTVMPPSQLKQLKASLRDQGLVGPQKSKKQKKVAAKDAVKKQKRNAALQDIRDRFNPFEVKAPARKEKFEVVGIRDGRAKKGIQGRPGVTKGLGEERRRATLLKEIQSRNKVGQIVDRRFGENDPTMTPEQRAAERFARQSERQLRKNSVFNLEDEAEDNIQLTHMGRSLNFDETSPQDDFKDDDLPQSDQESDKLEDEPDLEDLERPVKRRRLSQDEDEIITDQGNDGLQLPEKKKSKQEVMKEVIAKSKLHKYERQQAKEDDDDLRAELDKGLSGFLELMRGYRKPTPPALGIEESGATMNPDRAALLAGKDRHEADQEYNERIRQMAMDKRSKPSTRTKTDEEKAGEEAARLKELEEKRLRRMQGAPESSDEDNEQGVNDAEDVEQDDAEAFGLGQAVDTTRVKVPLGVEDEDDFILDDDLIASDSEADLATEDEESSREGSVPLEDDGDDDFINGLVLPPDSTSQKAALANGASGDQASAGNLSFTYPCPATHDEFLKILKDTDVNDTPTVVQRIRALYHPKLNAGNKEKLETFAGVLTQHVAYLADQEPHAPFGVLESLLRHLHSLAKSHPSAVSAAFRARLKDISNNRPLELRPGDFIILTGISTIFPTSDHFHTVVTPAGLTIARFLGQSPRNNPLHLVKGAYCCTLALQYQKLSKRYIPEVLVYLQQALSSLTAVISNKSEPLIRSHIPPSSSARLSDHTVEPFSSLRFESLYDAKAPASSADTTFNASTDNQLKATLISTFLALLDQASEMWQYKTAFPEIFEPATLLLSSLLSNATHLSKPLLYQTRTLHTKLTSLRQSALTNRLPLLLHNHRPLPIKTSIPKFEESYNPDRHYDPDHERSELNKLKAEHKRERKGALRELRKDANFVAREQLREKKERDEAHEKKMRRLVAEIQGEEGREGKVYEREKRRRTGKW